VEVLLLLVFLFVIASLVSRSIVEGLISIVAPDAGPYLPGGTLSTLAAGGNDQLAWGAALGLAVLYGVVAATASLAVFRTRDIVS
jgi:hypothetical protein